MTGFLTLKGKRALITGGTQGAGAATVALCLPLLEQQINRWDQAPPLEGWPCDRRP